MKLVEALDSFLYQGLHVNTGNKINVDEKDIPKLVEAQKISPQYLEIPPEKDWKNWGNPGYLKPEIQTDKFLKQAKISKNRKK